LKETIVTTLSTKKSIQEVIDRLKYITKEFNIRNKGKGKIRYFGSINSDSAVLSKGGGFRSPTLLFKYHTSGGITLINISNDVVSRASDNNVNLIIFTFPMGICISLIAIYLTFKKSEPSYWMIICGLLLASVPFIYKPNVLKEECQEYNDREIEWLCKYLDAVRIDDKTLAGN
jgi:hypothetical protein